MQVCFSCFSLQTHREGESIVCDECMHTQTLSSYLTTQRKAKDAVRHGYLYRIRYENDQKKKITDKAYSLIDLNEAFDFFAKAVISGIAGNFAYDQIKLLFGKLRKNRILIEIDDDRLRRFLKSERQQEKFIKYIEEYRQKKIKPAKKDNPLKKKTTRKPK